MMQKMTSRNTEDNLLNCRNNFNRYNHRLRKGETGIPQSYTLPLGVCPK